MLDIKKLYYLEAIYRYKNFTRASEELFVSQPAISTAISSLEKQLDVKLIERTPKAVTFTKEGEVFMDYVKNILSECDEGERKMQEMADARNQQLRLGISPTFTQHILPYLYTGFLPAWKEANVTVFEGPMESHIQMLIDDQLDLSYNALPSEVDTDLIEVKKIAEAELKIVMSRDHRLAGLDRIPVKELDGESVALPGPGARIRELILELFNREGIVPHMAMEHEQLICMFDMLKIGSYIAFVNEGELLDMVCSSENVVARSFEDPVMFDIGFMMSANRFRPRIVKELISFIEAMSRLK